MVLFEEKKEDEGNGHGGQHAAGKEQPFDGALLCAKVERHGTAQSGTQRR